MDRVINTGRQTLFIRPWADGKVLMMSADEQVKSEWIKLRAEEDGVLELLTDPETRVAAEDTEGVMAVIADPEQLIVTYNMAEERLGFAILNPEPFMEGAK